MQLVFSRSQSPQTGQFNSYISCWTFIFYFPPISLNPLKRVNSILTLGALAIKYIISLCKVSIPSNGSIQFLHEDFKVSTLYIDGGLNPLKRVNSILTFNLYACRNYPIVCCLNPLKRVNSILTIWRSQMKKVMNRNGLNPLKRVNSILTQNVFSRIFRHFRKVSIPSNGSIQFLQKRIVYFL